MNIQQVKSTMRGWICDNKDHYPGLRASHLVGSLTSMPNETVMPDDKDVDLLLIFDDHSPMLAPNGPFSNNLEFSHQGLMVECGLKPLSGYCDAQTVLANPEIAHHLTLETILYDPKGCLKALQPQIRKEYHNLRWVQARIADERRRWEEVDQIYHQLPSTAVLPQVMLIGYAYTYLSCTLSIATLQAPSTNMLTMRRLLADYNRCDLYETHLRLLGLDRATPNLVQQTRLEAGAAFDLAVQIRQSPHPFQHKLHAHLKPYFMNKSRRLQKGGSIPEALGALLPYYIASLDVMMADGSSYEKDHYSRQAKTIITDLGFGSAAAQEEKWAESRRLGEEIFELAHAIVAQNPAIIST